MDTRHGADGDNVTAGGDSSPGKCTHTHVLSAFGDTISSLTRPGPGIVCAACIENERTITHSRVESAVVLFWSAKAPVAVLASAGCVVQEREKTGGRVESAGRVAWRELTPVAVFKLPVVLLESAL